LINFAYSFVKVLTVFKTFGLISVSIAASVGLNSSSSPLFSSFLSVSPEFLCLALGPVFSSSM